MERDGARILVTGAAGKTGLAVLRSLSRKNLRARALVRRAAQEEAVRGAGACEVVRGDFLDPQSMAAAVDGVAAVYHICPNVSPDEVEIAGLVLAVARRSGVGRFVYHSVLHPQAEAMPHHWRKLRVEEMIFEAGLPFTIVQPAAYMQNVLGRYREIAEHGVLRVPYPRRTRLTMVDLEDIAEVAVEVLVGDEHCSAVYELCGSESLDQNEVAGVLAEVLGLPVRVEVVSLEAWRQEARAAGLDGERIGTLLAMFRYYTRHGFEGNPNVLRWLLGRPPTSFREAAANALRAAVDESERTVRR